MDRFLEMQTFAAVVDAGSFIKASETLVTSKAAVSRYVLDLESRLGVRLLHRTTRKLSLTEEGEVFYARCLDLLTLVDEAEAEITERSGRASGRIKLNAPVTFSVLHLGNVWGAFQKQHPSVTFDVSLSDRVVDLVDEGYDLAIRIAKLPASTLISRKLSSTRMVLCASPNYLKEMGVPLKPSDLSSHATLSYSYSSGKDEWEFEGPDGNESVKINPFIHTNSGDICRAGALDDQGIILQPSFLIGPDIKAGKLIEILPDYRAIELGIYAVYPTRKHLPSKIRLLIDFLIAHFKVAPWE